MDDLLAELARQVRSRYYGKYRGFVADNRDPERMGRLRLRVPSVLGDQATGWALPCVPFGGARAQGWFAVPEVDAQLWVEFEEGDLRRPIWTGTFWQKGDDVPDDARLDAPTTRLFVTPSGHALQFDDEDGKARVRLRHAGGAEIVIDEKGSLTITDQKGNAVTLDADEEAVRVEDTRGNALVLDADGATLQDANGNTVALSASGVRVKGQQIVVEGTSLMLGGQGGEPVIKGSTFLQLFATHTHTAPPTGGPTSPPIPQGEATALSTTVMVK